MNTHLKDKLNMSAFITEAVREKLDAEAKVRKGKELALAYSQAFREERELLEEWEGLAGEALGCPENPSF